MTIRAPLVLNNGQIQQLQSGDAISSTVSTASTRSLTNGESATAIVIGAPVYISAAATVKRAQANAMSTAKAIGLAYDTSTAAAAAGNVAVDGVMTATTTQWDAVVTSETGGLTAGTTYYVDPSNVGKLTTTPPTTVGQVVMPVGIALSPTDMEIIIGQPILL